MSQNILEITEYKRLLFPIIVCIVFLLDIGFTLQYNRLERGVYVSLERTYTLKPTKTHDILYSSAGALVCDMR